MVQIHISRGCVSMGARGAMAPTNFEKDAFGTHDGTHEILKSPYNGTHVFKFPTHPLLLFWIYLTLKQTLVKLTP